VIKKYSDNVRVVTDIDSIFDGNLTFFIYNLMFNGVRKDNIVVKIFFSGFIVKQLVCYFMVTWSLQEGKKQKNNGGR
jgi:hypothetical protein